MNTLLDKVLIDEYHLKKDLFVHYMTYVIFFIIILYDF